ncbi:hypothetical protein [Acidovorax sp. BL-A-41-H1]|uniref:hypothetical protein n=1 Tax=Acidovorax sp. BL-A-41-H1 TaxID=3421102 RepID=UPI003F7A055B
MKQLTITIQLQMTVPDDWEVQETSEGTPVIRMGEGKFLDMAVEPLFATDPEDMWSSTDDEAALEEIMEMVESEEVTYELQPEAE